MPRRSSTPTARAATEERSHRPDVIDGSHAATVAVPMHMEPAGGEPVRIEDRPLAMGDQRRPTTGQAGTEMATPFGIKGPGGVRDDDDPGLERQMHGARGDARAPGPIGVLLPTPAPAVATT